MTIQKGFQHSNGFRKACKIFEKLLQFLYGANHLKSLFHASLSYPLKCLINSQYILTFSGIPKPFSELTCSGFTLHRSLWKRQPTNVPRLLPLEIANIEYEWMYCFSSSEKEHKYQVNVVFTLFGCKPMTRKLFFYSMTSILTSSTQD